MTLEELWRLYPVILKDHDPRYHEWYAIEAQNILAAIQPEAAARINHIGSSAVTGLISKPTVDILLEMDGGCIVSRLTEALQSAGWTIMAQQNDPFRLSFNKGYLPGGFAEKVFHLHVVYLGDWNELYFRDFLMAHPDIAEAYGQLKLRLLKPFQYDRDGYTAAKSDFILKYSTIAKQEYHNKYRAGGSFNV